MDFPSALSRCLDREPKAGSIGQNPRGNAGCLKGAGHWSQESEEWQEPPYTEPYVRWWGRTEGASPPPTRLPPHILWMLYIVPMLDFCLKPSIQTTLKWLRFGSKSSIRNLCVLQWSATLQNIKISKSYLKAQFTYYETWITVTHNNILYKRKFSILSKGI